MMGLGVGSRAESGGPRLSVCGRVEMTQGDM